MELAVWDWPGAGSPLLFVHGTGFHGRCWDRVIHAFPGRRCLAVDLRGHGCSSSPKGVPEGAYAWRSFAHDLVEVVDRLDLHDVTGIGHSLGGHAVTLAAAMRPEGFDSLLLLDPVILPSHWYRGPVPDFGFVRRHRDRWKSPDQMFDMLSPRRPFQSWDAQVLRDYCEHGLLPREDGWKLACPPDVEAAIYPGANAPDANIYREIAGFTKPVTVVRSGTNQTDRNFDLTASPTAPELAWRFPYGRDVRLKDLTHFIPMESPERVAAYANWISREAGHMAARPS